MYICIFTEEVSRTKRINQLSITMEVIIFNLLPIGLFERDLYYILVSYDRFRYLFIHKWIYVCLYVCMYVPALKQNSKKKP